MADNMTFPIKFDLEKGVNDAIKDWNDKYADKLEKAIQKRALNVKLKFDTKAFDNLDDVKRRLAELKITPLTPENKTAIRELVRELKELARIMEKIQKFKGIELPELQMAKAAKLRKDVAQADEKLRLSQERVRISNERLILSQQRAAQQAGRTSKAFGTQSGYLERLIKRMAIYASFSYAGNFLTSVREVTAQFELQRISLGAILQDQNKANQLFSEIKSFALKSPVKILDLTKYTKQLAAYKVGYDELFETTKKLTDVSVGLGVSMDRVVLAYGQVRATGYLRASEVRQFTEMGVPIVEELAEKLRKLNGEAVTAADVMELISKRGISFEMVKDVFNDMTSAGGIFYNMQEKQGNTLYGMWAKLGDAASVMYSEIGNTGAVGQGMRTLIQWATDVMKHWQSWAKLIGVVGVAYLANAGALKLLRLATVRFTAAGKVQIAATKAKVATLEAEVQETRKAGLAAQWGAKMDLAVAKAKYRAATATNVFSKALFSLKAAILSNPIGWLITAVGAAIAIFGDFSKTIDDLQSNLSEINEKYTLKRLTDADNFKALADGAIKAANGSKEQRDKLEELDRTYGKIVGSENLQIDKLSSMTDGYDSLIQQVKEYNRQMEHQEREGEIKSFYGEKKKSAYSEWEDELSTIGIGENELGHEAGASIAVNVQSGLLEEIKKNGMATAANANRLLADEISKAFMARGWERSRSLTRAWDTITALNDETKEYVEALNAEQSALDAETARYEKAGGELAKLRKELEGVNNAAQDYSLYMSGKGYADEKSFAFQQGKSNWLMKQAADLIRNSDEYKKVMGDKAEELIRNSDEYKKVMGDKAEELEAEWLHYVDKLNPQKLRDVTSINFDALLALVGDQDRALRSRILAIQEEWGNVAPSDPTVMQIRTKLINLSATFDPALDKMQKYLWDGSGTVDEYLKKLREQQDALKAQLKKWQATVTNWSIVSALRNGMSKEQMQQKIADVKEMLEILNKEEAFVVPYTEDKNKDKGGSGRQSDPRLQNLKEEISLYEKLYQEYKQYEKAVGSSKAAEYMEREAKDTIDALAKKYGIGLPKNVTDLTSALEILYKKMQALPSKVFKNLDKELKEFRWKIEKVDIDDSQKKIEAQLKELSDRISRTKTAKEFYEKILGMTGDVELAANLSLSIYGENGEDLDKAIRDNIQAILGKNKEGIDLDFSAAIRADGSVDYNALTKIAKGYLDMGEISEETYNKILKMRDEDRKDLAETVEGWTKATEKAKTYSDKLLDLRRKTQNEIDSINEKEARRQISPEFAESQRAGFLRKEAEEVAKLQYEAFKDSPMYVQMFDDLDNASTTMLRNMKQRIEELKTSWKDLTPTQLKEMQSRLNEIDTQLAKRNPFSTLAKAITDYRKLRKGGDDGLGPKSEGAAEKALDAAAKARLEAEKEYLEILNKEGATQEEIAKAKERFDKAASKEDAAAKALENWKKVKDAIGLSANELFQMLNWAGDIAKGIADISEAMGADEEDVQYWNDVADALGQISGGIQDIVSAAMSGNVTGIISSTLTAIPKMFVGFANLFSAGKIKRANKEIKRQQELLEQLEYTYGRLEKAADKVFGTDYVNNYNQQLKNLQAQQAAYLKQAEAERSKGKKKDEEKIKEYEEAARETAYKIKELQEGLVAHFTGSTKTDVARQMAQSWIDARASMSDTFAAIKGDYQELIKNMIVEGAAARVIENALTPVWDNMQKMLDKNDVQGAIDSLIGGMDAALSQANSGMEVLWKALEARGYDMKKLIGDTDSEYTGIAKSVAGATSEEINNVAAIGNTLLYYASPIPRIDENLARVVAMMEAGGGAGATSATTSAGWTDWQQQAMDNYQAIARNTADTVVECRRAAEACERITRLIKTKGATSGINVFLNS